MNYAALMHYTMFTFRFTLIWLPDAHSLYCYNSNPSSLLKWSLIVSARIRYGKRDFACGPTLNERHIHEASKRKILLHTLLSPKLRNLPYPEYQIKLRGMLRTNAEGYFFL